MKGVSKAKRLNVAELLQMRQRLAELKKVEAERRQAEDALRISQASLFRVIDSNADGIIIVDREGIVLYLNPAAEAILGRKVEELLGEDFGFPVVAGGTTELDIVHRGGETGVAEMRMVETEWEGESAYLASLRDITERKRMEKELQESEEKLNRYLESSPDTICVTDLKGTILYINGAVERMMGYSREEFLGKNFLKLGLLAPGHTSKPTQWLEAGGAESHFRPDEFELIKKDGSRVFVEVSTLSVYPEGEVDKTEVIGIVRDITERKKAEEARLRMEQELQEKVTELETFSYGIAHDLRSPLLSIERFSYELQEDIQNQNMENVQEDIQLLQSGVRKMRLLVDRTLEYSRAGYLVKPTENIPFSKIVEEVIADFAEQLSSIGATVSLADGFPMVFVDRMRMVQLLNNLIQNSIKYRDKTVPLRIEIGYQPSEDEVIFLVRDNGSGIDAGEREKVFDLFYQGTADGEGSGAGLAIVKRIIEAHRGRVWAEQGQAGKGTTICFALPQQNGANN